MFCAVVQGDESEKLLCYHVYVWVGGCRDGQGGIFQIMICVNWLLRIFFVSENVFQKNEELLLHD